jgi:fission process protein 1
MQVDEPKVDIYRDTPLRYAGYLNEVGEAFRPLVAVSVVIASYVGALTYVSADAISKGGETACIPENEGLSGCGLAAVIDTLVFQLLASVIFPSTVINRGVALCKYLTEEFDAAGNLAQTLSVKSADVLTSLNGVDITCDSIASTIPTVFGLALIPIIAPPIDAIVEKILEEVVRPWLTRTWPDCELPMCDREKCDIINR